MFTAVPCTGVCRGEEPPHAFFRMPCVNSMRMILIITCGGRCFEVLTLVIIQLTNTRSNDPKTSISVRAGRGCIAVQPYGRDSRESRAHCRALRVFNL